MIIELPYYLQQAQPKWAGLLAHFISRKRDDVSVGQLKAQMDSLTSVVSALKTYSEQIVRNVAKSDSEEIISNVDKELHAKQRESMLRSIRGLSHLINEHEGKPDAVFKAFSDADSLDHLFTSLDKVIDGSACGVAKDMLLHSQDEVNQIRLKLGLKPFPVHDSNEFEEPRFRRLYKSSLEEREKGKRKNVDK